MSITTTIYSQIEIEKMINQRIEKLREEFYKELNKLYEQIVDLNQILDVLNRGNIKKVLERK